MQVTQVRLVAGAVNLDLPWLNAPEDSKFIVKSIDGLGPSESSVLVSGKTYQGRSTPNKQVTILVDLYPDWAEGETPSDLRNEIYRVLTPGLSDVVPLKLMNGAGVEAAVDSVPSKVEIVPFTKDPVLQIVLECLDKYFTSPISWEYNSANFGSTKTGYVVPNLGNAPTGFFQEITFTAGLTDWSLYKGGAGVAPKIQINYAFASGDILQINTIEGQRSLKRIRSGVTLDLLPYLSQDSTFLQLHGGDNTFWTSSQSFNWGKVIHTPLYWGI